MPRHEQESHTWTSPNVQAVSDADMNCTMYSPGGVAVDMTHSSNVH